MTAEAWGEALAAHALAAYAAMLVALLGVSAALWIGARRAAGWAAGTDPARMPPAWWVAVRMALGFAFVVGAGALFAELSEGLDPANEIGRFDTALARALGASLSPAALQCFALVTRLGDAATQWAVGAAVALVLVWRGRWRLAVAWSLALAGNGVLTRTLKAVFERARPVHEHGYEAATGYSFPSGHSSGAVVVYGLLAWLLMRHASPRARLPLLLAAVATAYTVGASRVFLQVHYASDVLAGFTSGSAWLAVCLASLAWSRARRRAARGHAGPG